MCLFGCGTNSNGRGNERGCDEQNRKRGQDRGERGPEVAVKNPGPDLLSEFGVADGAGKTDENGCSIHA